MAQTEETRPTLWLEDIIANQVEHSGGFIGVNPDGQLTIKIQDGPIKEHGVNGCQIDALIELTVGMLRHFNKAVPSRETSLVITKLEEALHWLAARTKEREKRSVEGTNQA